MDMGRLYLSIMNTDSLASSGAGSAAIRGWRARVRRHPFLSVLALFILGLVVVSIAVGLYVARLVEQAPDVARMAENRLAAPSVVLAADGSELSQFQRQQRQWLSLDQISPHVLDALLATEDRRFYEHRGVDVSRTLAAMFHTVQGDTQGGSTLTQQLARNLFPEQIGRARNVTRKVKEIITALEIERTYSKQQILETYLNTVPFLYNAFGIEMAARTYFKKNAAELDRAEAATLVGMLKGTYYYNPVLHPERAKARRNLVLQQMQEQGTPLPEAEYQRLRERPLTIDFERQVNSLGVRSHFTQHVRKWLLDWAEENGIDLETAGLTVHTTLDPVLQDVAEAAVARQTEALQNVADVEWGRASTAVLSHRATAYARLNNPDKAFSHLWKSRPALLQSFIRESPAFADARAEGLSEVEALARLQEDAAFIAALKTAKTRLEAGFVALDPKTGAVKAWVGSRDFARDQFDHVAQAVRQPGSTFKPIVYGAALEQGLSPTRAYEDLPVTIQLSGGGTWRPTDMSAPTLRRMSMREGLVHSKNTITAQVMQDAGVKQVVRLAQAMGVKHSPLVPVPSLALGTSPVTLLEMSSVYATIAHGGLYRQPVVIQRILGRDGDVLLDTGVSERSAPSRVMNKQTAEDLVDMLRGAVRQGTGRGLGDRFGLRADLAGKTGTTQDNTDGWFIAMHPQLVAGAWVGFNDTRVTMRSNYWGQGGHNALLLVGDFLRQSFDEKLLDAGQTFPGYRRASVLTQRAPEEDETAQQEALAAMGENDAPLQIVRERLPNGTIYIGDRESASLPRPSRSTQRTPEEMAEIMLSLGRDPDTGVLLESEAHAAGTSTLFNGNQGTGQ